MQKAVVHDSDPLFPFASYVIPSHFHSVLLSLSVPSTSKPPQIIVQCLRRLGSMSGYKNVLKKIDYDNSNFQKLNHLPPPFWWHPVICPPCSRSLIISNQGQVVGRHGQTLWWPCLVEDSNHQHYKHYWCRISFFYLCWPYPMPKPELWLPSMRPSYLSNERHGIWRFH